VKKPTSRQYFKEITECPDCKLLDNGKTFIRCSKHKAMAEEIIKNMEF